MQGEPDQYRGFDVRRLGAVQNIASPCSPKPAPRGNGSEARERGRIKKFARVELGNAIYPAIV